MKLWPIIAAIALMAIGFYLGRRTSSPSFTLQTDTLWVDRVIRDTIFTPPQVRIIYRPIETVKVETVRVPISLDRFVVAPAEAVRIEPGRAIWTYWKPEASRWEQAIYRTLPPRRELRLAAGALWDDKGVRPALALTGRYSRLEARALWGIPQTVQLSVMVQIK